MKNKVLFLENKNYLNELGIFKDVLYFDGIKDYSISDNKIKKYDLLISQLYTNPVSNFLILKAKKNNIKTILVADGITDWANSFSNPMNNKYKLNQFHPILHDIFLCVGKDESEYFNFLGYKTMQYLPDRMAPTIPRLGRGNNQTFLITTANTAYYNEDEKRFLVDLLKQIINQLKKLNIKYVFRIFDSKLIEELNIEASSNKKDGSYEECLSNVDYVITTPSSISFTTMYHGKPLAHLIYRDSPIFIQSGWNLSGSINIEESLKKMMTYDVDRMNFQEFQVSKYIIENEKIEKEVLEKLKNLKDENIEKFINQNLYNMLNSSFNFNIEYFVRRIYLKFKGMKIMTILRKKIK